MSEKKPRGYRVVVEDVMKIYQSGDIRVPALRGVSLTVEPGEIVAIMGPSGSGKTTLLNIIGGVDKPSSGRVLVNNIDITRLPEASLRKYRLKGVGYIFQFFNLIPTLTTLENVILPMLLAEIDYSTARKRAKKLLEEVGIAEKANRLPEELSGGERQRLSIAVALANDPKMIIADEPTGELDIVNAEKVMKILIRLAKEEGKTVIVSTHDPRVARMTDKIYLLQDGLIRGVYTPEKIGGEVALEEISLERGLVGYIKQRLAKIDNELATLEEMFRKGELKPLEFVEKYHKLVLLREALKEELAKLGAGIEA